MTDDYVAALRSVGKKITLLFTCQIFIQIIILEHYAPALCTLYTIEDIYISLKHAKMVSSCHRFIFINKQQAYKIIVPTQ